MRIVVASCSVVYSGRGDTKLAQGVRAIIIKDDGAISIHNDKSNKPLNYMGKGNVLTEETVDGCQVWYFDARKESLRVTLHEIISDTNFDLMVDDEGLVRDGTENHLQAWLADHPEVLGEGFTFVQREFPTGAGAVDLLVRDAEGKPVAVEVKRVAMPTSVYQALRYVDALKEQESFSEVTGMVVAVDLRPNMISLAQKRGIRTVEVSANWNNN
jgi:RecB family endonuclease NucS